VIGSSDAVFWVEPGTHDEYPMSYFAYRRTREAQERAAPRHRGLGPDIDRYLARRWRSGPALDVDVVLTIREGVSPRVRRIVAEVLRAIRRGRRAKDAVRHVARRFGLRPARARAFISSAIDFEIRVRRDPMSFTIDEPCPSTASAGGYLLRSGLDRSGRTSRPCRPPVSYRSIDPSGRGLPIPIRSPFRS